MKTMTKVWIDKQTKQLAKWKWKIEWKNAREKSNLLVAGDLLEIYHNTRYFMAWEEWRVVCSAWAGWKSVHKPNWIKLIPFLSFGNEMHFLRNFAMEMLRAHSCHSHPQTAAPNALYVFQVQPSIRKDNSIELFLRIINSQIEIWTLRKTPINILRTLLQQTPRPRLFSFYY